MNDADPRNRPVEGGEALRDEWLGRLNDLLGLVEGWAKKQGWATRRIEKTMEDLEIGRYRAPAPLLQGELAKIILEPIGWSAPDEEGLVDLYLMPAYDDIARLFFSKGRWQMLYLSPGEDDAGTPRKARSKSFSEGAFRKVLDAMREHPRGRHEWIEQIKAIEREHAVMRLAIDRLSETARGDPSLIGGGLALRDLGYASRRLDGTYIIRLFAEFETALRSFWPTKRGTDPPSRTRDLVNGVAATRKVPPARLRRAHEVRDYRNALLHEREEAMTPIPVAEARGHLCHYLSYLPPEW